MKLLLLSTLAVLIGPLLHRIANGARWAMAAFDGFVLVIVSGIVLGKLLPHAYAEAGWPAILIAAGGYLAVRRIERLSHLDGHRAHDAALLLGFAGFAFHEFLDGVALVTGGGDHPADHLLPLAIVLHRVPIGLSIWWLIRPRFGLVWGVLAMALIVIASALGYWLGAEINGHFSGSISGVFQSLVCGALLHVVTHSDMPVEGAPRLRQAAGLGGLLAVGLLALLQSDLMPPGRGGEASMARTLALLALESAPALLIAYAAAGAIGVFLPHAGVAWMRRGPALVQAARGVAFGLPLPICSCGVLPVYRSLIARGAPAAAAMAFLVAGPELGVDAVLLSFPLLGLRLTVARLLCAAVVALAVGVLVGKRAGLAHPDAVTAELPSAPSGSLGQKLRAALSLGFVETIDHTGPWILLGLAIAAAIEPIVGREWVTALPRGWDVPLFALLGMPMYVCASAATPLVAVLVHKGVSPGAAIAFLLTGPATNVTTFGILAQIHGRRIAMWFALAIAGTTILLGWATNIAVGRLPGYPFHVGHQHPGALYPICLALLTLLFAASFLRQGPRSFLAQLTSVASSMHGDDGHGHHHADAHAHEPPHPVSCHAHSHGHDHAHECHHEHEQVSS